MTPDDGRRLLSPLLTKVKNLVGRGVIKKVDDGKKMQELQVSLLPGELRDEVEHFQPYGFTSNPEPGAEAVVVFVGGYREHGLAVAVDDRRYRLKNLKAGEVALYDKAGSRVLLKTNGDIEITPASGVVKVNGDVTADGISLKNHTHNNLSLTVSGTSPSGAVTGTATGNTGAPS